MDDLYTDPFEAFDDDTRFQLTAKGLHLLGVIDETALAHFERVECERDEARELVEEYDAIIAFLVSTLTEILASDPDEVYDIANNALDSLTQVAVDE